MKAVIFDLGGVILGSPFSGFAEMEAEMGLPQRWIAGHILAAGDGGAFVAMESGTLTPVEFAEAFRVETAASGREIDGNLVLATIARVARPRKRMLTAVERIRAHGMPVGVITNNWCSAEASWTELEDRFDVFVQSWVEGIRKPDPRIYSITCDRLGVDPPECVFLDDIGSNLKPARRMGMTTIKVDDPDRALAELSDVLGFEV